MKTEPIQKYNAIWNTRDAVFIEMECIRNGGQWVSAASGKVCGLGELDHYLNLSRLLWPTDYDTKWTRLIFSELVRGGIVGLAGPSSSGKTHSMAKFGLMIYWCFPNDCTILVCTTTREMLEMRIWGEIKRLRKAALARYPKLPGYLTDSYQSITTDPKGSEEGKDFRNGIKAVPCIQGEKWISLGSFVGVKNNIVIVMSDEAPLMASGFYESMGNLRSNSIKRPFTMVASGNPKDPIDAFGKLCQPKGGWDFLEQGDKTQVWETKESGGRCVRLVGTDSPNLDCPEGAEPYSKIIGRKYIKEIEETYGKDSWQYETWVLARFPTQVLSRRLFTRQMCEKFNAFDEPHWDEGKITKLFAMDAAYRGVGGDRCVGGEFWIGTEQVSPRLLPDGTMVLGGDGYQILALIGKPILVPIRSDGKELPEDQIADYVRNYCENRDIPASNVFYDGTGRADLTAAFARTWSTQVNPIEFGGSPSDRPDPQDPNKECTETYFNFASELNYVLRAIIQSRQFRGMTMDIVEEAEHRAWDIVGKSKVKIETKDLTKERLKRSPDLLDMAIAGAEGARRLGFGVKRLGAGRPNIVNKNNVLSQWRKRWQQINRSHELTAT